MTAIADEPIIRFENIAIGGELWGGTQANFVVNAPDRNAREIAVLLNDPSAVFLAGLAGREDTPEFRAEAARTVGETWLREAVAAGERLPSVVFVSTVRLQSEPGLLEEVKARLAKAPATGGDVS